MSGEFDAAQVDRALAFDAAWTALLREQWRDMMDLAVWGDCRAEQLGAAPRLRKRLLELGERLRSLTADRAWIPHPRERLKSALAAARAVRESLDAVAVLLPVLAPSADTSRLHAAHAGLCAGVARELPALERVWAEMLDAQLGR